MSLLHPLLLVLTQFATTSVDLPLSAPQSIVEHGNLPGAIILAIAMSVAILFGSLIRLLGVLRS